MSNPVINGVPHTADGVPIPGLGRLYWESSDPATAIRGFAVERVQVCPNGEWDVTDEHGNWIPSDFALYSRPLAQVTRPGHRKPKFIYLRDEYGEESVTVVGLGVMHYWKNRRPSYILDPRYEIMGSIRGAANRGGPEVRVIESPDSPYFEVVEVGGQAVYAANERSASPPTICGLLEALRDADVIDLEVIVEDRRAAAGTNQG